MGIDGLLDDDNLITLSSPLGYIFVFSWNKWKLMIHRSKSPKKHFSVIYDQVQFKVNNFATKQINKGEDCKTEINLEPRPRIQTGWYWYNYLLLSTNKTQLLSSPQFSPPDHPLVPTYSPHPTLPRILQSGRAWRKGSHGSYNWLVINIFCPDFIISPQPSLLVSSLLCPKPDFRLSCRRLECPTVIYVYLLPSTTSHL